MAPPWDPLIALFLDELTDRIEADGDISSIARVVARLPMLCREAYHQWRLQPKAPWLRFYALHAVHIIGERTQPKHFFDYVPSGISIDDEDRGDYERVVATVTHDPDGCFEQVAATSKSADVNAVFLRLRVARILNERGDDLSGGHMDSDVTGPLSLFLATRGLPAGLPLKVRRFVGFCRWMCTSSRMASARARPPCNRRGCTRCATISPPLEGESSAYWKRCQPAFELPLAHGFPYVDYFCCALCRNQTRDEFDRVILCNIDLHTRSAVEFVSETRARASRGRAQQREAIVKAELPPSRLYRAALKRNDLLKRRLAHAAKMPVRNVRCDAAEREWIRGDIIFSLNVDTGLLFAASVLHELPMSQRTSRVLPEHVHFRAAAVPYLKAISAIKTICAADPTTRTRLMAPGATQPRWIQKIKDCVLELF